MPLYLNRNSALRDDKSSLLDLKVDLENFSPSMLMLDIGSKVKDRKLQDLRNMSGISSDESNVLAVGRSGGTPLRISTHPSPSFAATAAVARA